MPKRRKLLLLSLVFAVLALLTLAILIWGRTPPSLPPLPNPNGYDTFAKAGGLVKGDVANASLLDHEGLSRLVLENAEALRFLRAGLTQFCAVPITTDPTNFATISADLPRLKALALLLRAQGSLAEIENRSGDAALNYTEAIQLGNQIGKNGLMLNRLVGVSCEAIGENQLARVIDKLNLEQTRRLIAELASIDSARITWNDIQGSEWRFFRSQPSFHNPISLAAAWWMVRPAKQRAKARHKIAVAHTRLLEIELALRCYRAERGQIPARLDNLVPDYLNHMPLDPFGDRSFIYTPQGTNWLLYSVGPDGVDDGGKPVGRGPEAKGDLFYHSPW